MRHLLDFLRMDRLVSTGRVGAAALAVVATAALSVWGDSRVTAEPPPAYDLAPLPAGVDSLTPLARVAEHVAACAADCTLAVYLWTPRMPLSRAGIPRVASAAAGLGVPLLVASTDELLALAEGAVAPPTDGVARALLEAGALAHAPALVTFSGGEPSGPAILGYKSEGAYASLLARRIAAAESSGVETGSAARMWAVVAPASSATLPADFRTVGLPGAYFRWVPGRNAVAYESNQRIYMLDLASGENRPAPGFIDFVPTPDGEYFVTPGSGDGGLEFYDAGEVFGVVASGRIGEVEPIFTDLRMRDQYPSVGILERNATRTLYRILTSWFDTVVYRDYDVRVDPRSGMASVQPVGEPVRPCAGMSLSTPIMSQDGREIAARDEGTGTTKIYRILDGTQCQVDTDFGVPTSKVAWHASGRVLAFSIPRRGPDASERGIFVLDRDARTLVRVEGSEAASRLAFPDFVGQDSVIFLLPGPTARDPSYFRVVAVPR